MYKIILFGVIATLAWTSAFAANHVLGNGTEKSPYFVQLVPSEGDKEQAINQERRVSDAEHRQEERDRKQDEKDADKAWNDSVLMWATIVLAVGTVGLLLYTRMLWRSAKEDGEKQLTEMRNSLDIAREAAEAAKSANEISSKTVQLQSFEMKYVELIKMHRDNVAELKVGGSFGRKVFVSLVRELREILPIVRQVAGQFGQSLTNKQVMQIAYYCLFYGSGPNSSRMLRGALVDSKFSPEFVEALDAKLNDPDTKRIAQDNRGFDYVPFEGHQSRLGHYYRHLYQAVSFVTNQGKPLGINIYDYVKTIRAQLSTHEQALLLVNSLTPIGSNWMSKGFIGEYRMVQNIPLDFFDANSEIDLRSLFHYGYYEQQEA